MIGLIHIVIGSFHVCYVYRRALRRLMHTEVCIGLDIAHFPSLMYGFIMQQILMYFEIRVYEHIKHSLDEVILLCTHACSFQFRSCLLYTLLAARRLRCVSSNSQWWQCLAALHTPCHCQLAGSAHTYIHTKPYQLRVLYMHAVHVFDRSTVSLILTC